MEAQPGFAPNPRHIFDSFNAYQRSAALKAAVELDLFSAVAQGEATAGALASRIGASERGVRILCDSLVVFGLLEKHGSHYNNTQDTGFFLDRRSPAYMGKAASFLCHPEMTRSWSDLAQIVRKGTTVLPSDGIMKIENEIWVDFARGMAPLMVPPAQRIAELITRNDPIKVLDIAAGHGMYGITIAQKNSNAQIFALDWPNVLSVAQDNAQQFGVAERYHAVPGSFFDVDLGDGYDVILLPNFLHHFDRKTCVGIIAKCRKALKTGGTIATVEFVPDADRVSPATAASFALIMLAETVGGDAYTFADLESMFAEAGFSRTTRHEVAPGHPETVLISQ